MLSWPELLSVFPQRLRPKVARHLFPRIAHISDVTQCAEDLPSELLQLAQLCQAHRLSTHYPPSRGMLGSRAPVSNICDVARKVVLKDPLTVPASAFGAPHDDWVRLFFQFHIWRRPRFVSDSTAPSLLFNAILSGAVLSTPPGSTIAVPTVGPLWLTALRRGWFDNEFFWSQYSLRLLLLSSPTPHAVRLLFGSFPTTLSKDDVVVLADSVLLSFAPVPTSVLLATTAVVESFVGRHQATQLTQRASCFGADALFDAAGDFPVQVADSLVKMGLSGRCGMVYTKRALPFALLAPPRVGDVLAGELLWQWVCKSPPGVVAAWLQYAPPASVSALLVHLPLAERGWFLSLVFDNFSQAGELVKLPYHSVPGLRAFLSQRANETLDAPVAHAVFWSLLQGFSGTFTQAMSLAQACADR